MIITTKDFEEIECDVISFEEGYILVVSFIDEKPSQFRVPFTNINFIKNSI